MPDIAREQHLAPQGELSWVGMSRVHQPIRLQHAGGDDPVLASVGVYVDLTDPLAKGIHMSRLYLQLDEYARHHTISPASLKLLLNSMLSTHRDISGSARLEFEFDLCLRRPALKSDNSGWNNYPVTIDAVLEDGQYSFELGVEVTYSSTCPCSAALSRQLIQAAFDDAFQSREPNGNSASEPVSFSDVRRWLGTQQAIVATPHSQRSLANVKVRLGDVDTFPIVDLIDTLEDALATPVQTAVKREDEQEFALRNGQNLMFCEDAARKVKKVLDASDAAFTDYKVHIEHQESLHAHDAIAVVIKGVDGGYQRR
ncbi:MAG: GTP cyclohydrolase FolE2 [Pseudomonadales bacterium]